MRVLLGISLFMIFVVMPGRACAQALGTPDRTAPGDQQIQDHLSAVAASTSAQFAADVTSLEEWQARQPAYRDEFFYMLGLHPLPERTALKATITGTLERDGYVVEMIHYQSRPGLYVTGNLYRPATIKQGERLPAVFYVCGHAGRGRDGNKTAYQSHGIWFAKHGYVCLIVDTLQLGEIAAIHHGTYRENRWWWHSRGYTSAGVECWNGVRGIDYLISRADVDPQRLAVTGISGGGAATFWIAAADERVRVAVPVSGMADLQAYVPNRVINGHCDCMFLYNTFQWPWVRIAGLIAPRPLLFMNSNQDGIFPMDANERVIAQLEELYSLYGAGDHVDSVVSVGGHAYRQDLRQAAYRFINIHLKGDANLVTDSELDLVRDLPGQPVHSPIDPAALRVFPRDSDLPKDQLNTTIDEHFVPVSNVPVPAQGKYPEWKQVLLAEVKRVVFRSFPDKIPAAKLVKRDESALRIETEPGIVIRLDTPPATDRLPSRMTLVIANAAAEGRRSPAAISPGPDKPGEAEAVFKVWPRGTGETAWTRKNPPNYVERSHVLLGQTVDTGRVRDVIATLRFLRAEYPEATIRGRGEGPGAILLAYAALFCADLSEIVVVDPPLTHQDSAAPQFLNILRVADVPEMLGLLAPRKLEIVTRDSRIEKTVRIYQAAGFGDLLKIRAE